MSKNRIDVLMVNKGLCNSRQKAQALIMSGLVYINEVKVNKPSEQISDTDVIIIRDKGNKYVSRGAFKLEKALRVFNANVDNKICIDIGASTGGFTDVLLQNNAKKIYAVDVGFGQFDWTLRNDERVILMERTNARYLTANMFLEKPSIAVMDVSFISIKLIIPTLINIMDVNPILYVLIKPQFEAGKDKIGKNGVVRDPQIHINVIKDIRDFLAHNNLKLSQLDFSPITGPKGNIEYICCITKGNNIIDNTKIINTVESAHLSLGK